MSRTVCNGHYMSAEIKKKQWSALTKQRKLLHAILQHRYNVT